MEDNLNGRRPKWRTTSIGGNPGISEFWKSCPNEYLNVFGILNPHERIFEYSVVYFPNIRIFDFDNSACQNCSYWNPGHFSSKGKKIHTVHVSWKWSLWPWWLWGNLLGKFILLVELLWQIISPLVCTLSMKVLFTGLVPIWWNNGHFID